MLIAIKKEINKSSVNLSMKFVDTKQKVWDQFVLWRKTYSGFAGKVALRRGENVVSDKATKVGIGRCKGALVSCREWWQDAEAEI